MSRRKKGLRKKIISSAVKLFAKKGFYETTIEDIAKGAKIAKGTVYLYFKDKPTLYISIIDEHFVDGIAFLGKVQKEKLTNRKKLEKIASQWLSYMLKFRHSFPMLSVENMNLTKKIMKGVKPKIFMRFAEIVNIIGEIIQQGTKNGEFRKIKPHLGALYLLNVIRTAFIAHVLYPEFENPEKEIGSILMSGLKKETK
jgi:TetR/AcrR family fatty acid metabolism transcriptional regulator